MPSNGQADGGPKVTGPLPLSHLERRWIFPLLVGVFLASAAYFHLSETAEILPGDVVLKNGAPAEKMANLASTKPKRHKKKWGSKKGPTINTMLEAFQVQRQLMIESMEKDYGADNFKTILLNHSKTAIRSPTGPNGPSNDRMRRKIMIKILEAQHAAKKRTRSLRTHGQHLNKTMDDRRRTQEEDSPAGLPTYVWASGGHSAAAAHGNFWRESYTAVLERAVKEVFTAVGINFIGRNFAMGGTSSGPEIAMCTKEVYGTDIDLLSWDAGMTDGHKQERMAQYFTRAGILPKQPTIVALQVGKSPSRIGVLEDMEQSGMAAFVQVEDEDKAMTAGIPDTLGLTDDQIALMPEFVRNFKCGIQIEKGDPGCKELKFNSSMCNNRRFRTSWHPGWRWHAMQGNLYALWLTSMVEDALLELASKDIGKTLLADLRKEEEAAHSEFMQTPVAESATGLTLPDDVDRDVFFKGPNFCHTARLPAEIRHLGILTESDLVGQDSYDKGTEEKDAILRVPEDGVMQLVFEKRFRQVCEIPPNKDYKDYFYVADTQGWGELTLPNDAELKAYGTDKPLHGFIVVCFAACDWGKCPKGNLLRDQFHEGKVTVEVNGVAVANMTAIDQECELLKNDNGHMWKPNSKGRFQIRSKVNEEKSFVRFSSFVVW